MSPVLVQGYGSCVPCKGTFLLVAASPVGCSPPGRGGSGGRALQSLCFRQRASLGALSVAHGTGSAADNSSQARETLVMRERSFRDLHSVVLKWKCHFLLFSADRVLRIKAADGCGSFSSDGLRPLLPALSRTRHGTEPPELPSSSPAAAGCCPLPSPQEQQLLARGCAVPPWCLCRGGCAAGWAGGCESCSSPALPPPPGSRRDFRSDGHLGGTSRGPCQSQERGAGSRLSFHDATFAARTSCLPACAGTGPCSGRGNAVAAWKLSRVTDLRWSATAIAMKANERVLIQIAFPLIVWSMTAH